MELRVRGLRLRIKGSGFEVEGLRFKVSSFAVPGLVFRVRLSGDRARISVEGSGCRAEDLRLRRAVLMRVCLPFSGRGTTRAKDAQGTPTQSHISPSILVYEHHVGVRTARAWRPCSSRSTAPAATLPPDLRVRLLRSGVSRVGRLGLR